MKTRMTGEELAQALNSRGFVAVPNTAYKNGQLMHTVEITINEKVTAVLYEYNFPLPEQLEDVIKILEEDKVDKRLLADHVVKSFETIKDKLYLKIVPNTNERAQKPFLFRPCEYCADMAYVPYINEDGYTISITSQLCDALHISPEMVFETAKANTLKEEAIIQTMGSLIAAYPEFIPDVEVPKDDDSMIIISNKKGYNGAIQAFIKPQLLNDIGDCYILPSSIHETIACPANSPDKLTASWQTYLKDMVKDINQTEIDPQDFLSNSVFLYKKDTGFTKI